MVGGFDYALAQNVGLLGVYALEEGEGRWVYDATLRQQRGTVIGSPNWVRDVPLNSGWTANAIAPANPPGARSEF